MTTKKTIYPEPNLGSGHIWLQRTANPCACGS